MSGWRIVPAEMTPEMIESADGWTLPEDTWEYALKVAPEPDWEAMAEPICIALAMLAPTEFDAVVAALKATFGSKP